MEDPAETKTEYLYRTACDQVVERLSDVMRSISDAGKVPGGFDDKRGDILCDLAEIQGFLYRVCAAGVNKDTRAYLELITQDYKEISR